MTKPERRCLKEMTMGILKSKSVFVNQIAASLREPLKLKDVTKRLSAQYLKEDYADLVLEDLLETAAPGVAKSDFILMDGTDISKKHAKYMQGLELVNFVYYKISRIVSNLLIPVKSRWNIEKTVPDPSPGQLKLMFN